VKALRFILCVIGAVVALKFLYAAWFTTPLDDDLRIARLPLSTEPGQEPWITREPLINQGRNAARKMMLDALAMPVAQLCSESGRKHLVDALVYYYGQRARQEREYRSTFGDQGARYIASVWTTADDTRAERLTRETYNRGYFTLDLLRRYAATKEKVARVVQGERAGKSPCQV
jgi:hypothetical protein